MPRRSPQRFGGATCLENGMDSTGSYDSDDGLTSISWALPEWSDLDRKLCSLGVHLTSRKVVVTGYVSFSLVKRAYCACGRTCWIWYEDGWAAQESTGPGAHLHWIAGQIKMRRTFALHREWERAMSDQHPCWGEYRKCISCGCATDQPCVSHVDRPNPGFAEASRIRMEAARERQEELRAQMWPK